jgi:hypothetical protein
MDATSARSPVGADRAGATVRVAIRFAFVVVAAFADCGRRQKGEAKSTPSVAGPHASWGTRYGRLRAS